SQLIVKNRFQLAALERTLNRLAGHLLPPGAGLVIAHYEILVINSCKMEIKCPAIHNPLPHQTGVAERSISHGYRDASDYVRDHVMVGKLSNRISRRI